MIIARWFLFATAAVFVGFGIWGLVSPVAMVTEFGIELENPDAKTMIRASYGGFLIGEGALFGWCAMAAKRWRFGLTAIVLLTTPILLSRLFGMAFDGSASIYHRAYVVIELIGILGATLLLRHDSRNSGE